LFRKKEASAAFQRAHGSKDTSSSLRRGESIRKRKESDLFDRTLEGVIIPTKRGGA
jgi:hypothetical protein